MYMYASSSVLHNCCEIALEFNSWAMLQSSLHTSKFQLVTSRDLKGESQVYVFHLPAEVGFLPFYLHGFLKVNSILTCSSCRVKDLEAVQCAGCSTKL